MKQFLTLPLDVRESQKKNRSFLVSTQSSIDFASTELKWLLFVGNHGREAWLGEGHLCTEMTVVCDVSYRTVTRIPPETGGQCKERIYEISNPNEVLSFEYSARRYSARGKPLCPSDLFGHEKTDGSSQTI